MAEALGLAKPLAEEFSRLHEAGSVLTLQDGQRATINKEGYGYSAYRVSSIEHNEENEPVWTVAACGDAGEKDQPGAGKSLYITQGREQFVFDLRHPKSELPEWTLPLLNNIVAIDLDTIY